MELHDKATLLAALRNAQKPLAYLVGSPLSTNPDGTGVPTVTELVAIIRDRVAAQHNTDLERFEQSVQGRAGAGLYQTAFAWLQANVGQDAVNQVIREAVLRACVAPEAVESSRTDGTPEHWIIPSGTSELARLLTDGNQHFAGPVLTTNFDPLISLAVRGAGGNPIRRVLHSDGTLPTSAEEDSTCQFVVHLHGYWRDSDSLHTPSQLNSQRPKLTFALQRLLRQKTLLVVAYGAWDDVFTNALSTLLDDETSSVDVLWSFRESDAPRLREQHRSLFQKMETAIIRGRFRAYAGIDCHSIFRDIRDATHTLSAPAHSVTADLARRLDSQPSLLAPPPDVATALTALASIPRRPVHAARQFRYVREDAQSRLSRALSVSRFGWLVADWEMGKDDFISCVLARLRDDGGDVPAFSILCEECATVPEIETAVGVQFGMPLQRFCHLASALPSCDLILDGIAGVSDDDVRRLAAVVLDYCPTLRLLACSRRAPTTDSECVVTIRSLELPDIRNYLLHHADIADDLVDSQVVEKFHQLTGGIPRHLEAALQKLRVTSLDDVFLDEESLTQHVVQSDEPIPRDLIAKIGALAQAPDRTGMRSFKLLKVLSVLPDGETLDVLKRMYDDAPFHAQNANQLLELGLIEIVSIGRVGPTLRSPGILARSAVDSVKVLRVPRPVRDYVMTFINDADLSQIVEHSTDVLFGRKWRDGSIKLRSAVVDGDMRYGFGNEYLVIKHLIRKATAGGDPFFMERALRLALRYIQTLDDKDRYHDVATVGGDVIKLAGHELLTSCKNEAVALYATVSVAMRMTKRHSECLRMAEAAIELVGGDNSVGDIAALDSTLAQCYQAMGEKDAAMAAAERVRGATRKGSGQYIQATWIIDECKYDGDGLIEKGRRLESSARAEGSVIVANNIALRIADESSDSNEAAALRMWRRVIDSEGDDYNRVRGVVALAEFQSRRGRLSELKFRDRQLLEKSYSYLHSQRMESIFRRCHSVLWAVLKSEGLFGQLLRLFRHSSFFWRISGDVKHEKEFVIELGQSLPSDIESVGSTVGRAEVEYFKLREVAIIAQH